MMVVKNCEALADNDCYRAHPDEFAFTSNGSKVCEGKGGSMWQIDDSYRKGVA